MDPYDRRKTQSRNYFSQIALGGEYWIKNWFIGGNVYKPIGKNTKQINEGYAVYSDYKNIWSIESLTSEKTMSGVDAEVGCEFKEGLIGYIGGYYFGANEVNSLYGPKARLAYDWSLASGKRILGVLDKVGLEVGIQHDKPRGIIWYLSANVRVGWLPGKKAVLQGVSRHMVDPVRRDIDIVSATMTEKNIGRKYKIAHVNDKKQLEDPAILDADIIDIGIKNFDAIKAKRLVATYRDQKKKLLFVIDSKLDSQDVASKFNDLMMGKAPSTPMYLDEEGSITKMGHDFLETSKYQIINSKDYAGKTKSEYAKMFRHNPEAFSINHAVYKARKK